MSRLRVGLDITPLFDHPTGVTRFVSGLLRELSADPSLDVGGWILSARPVNTAGPAATDLPETLTRIRTPARIVHRSWGAGMRLGSRQLRDFDVVHGTNFAAPPESRSVISLHDLTLFESSHLSRRARERAHVIRRAVAGGSHLMVPSEHVRSRTIDMLGADPGRVTSIVYGLNPIQSTVPGAGLKRVSMPGYVLALGTVHRRKNLVRLARAMESMPPSLGLVVAGAVGDDEGAVREALTDLGSRRQVRRLTDVDDAARAELLRDAALLAYPSLDEGFGFPPIEAMSVGVPVVASDSGSIPEVVADAALLIDPSDTDSLSDAMLRALTPDCATELTRRGYRIAARYDWSNTASEAAEVYRRVASE